MNIKHKKSNIPLFFLLSSTFLLPFYIQGNSFFTILFAVSSILLFYKEIVFKDFLKFKFILPLIYFILLTISIFYSADFYKGANSVGRKAMFIVLPFVFIFVKSRLVDWLPKILQTFIVSNFIALTLSLMNACYNYLNSNNLDVFTHSNLVSFIGIQSTYLALYLLICIILLYFSYKYKILGSFFNPKLKTVLILYFSFGLILLSSRVLYIPFGVFILYTLKDNLFKNKIKMLSFILFLTFVFFLSFVKISLFQSRISELKNSNFQTVNLQHYEHDTPINGLTMRLLFFRLAKEILKENNWINGVGIGDTQNLLHSKFKEYNIYMGNPKIGDTGFLNYNFHNQYVETLMQVGLLGVGVLIIMFMGVILNKETSTPLIFFIFFSYLSLFIAEAALERLYGLSHISLFYAIFTNINIKKLIKKEKNFT